MLTTHEFLARYGPRFQYFEHLERWIRYGRWRIVCPTIGTDELVIYLDGQEFKAPLTDITFHAHAGHPVEMTLTMLTRSFDFDGALHARLKPHDEEMFGPDPLKVIEDQGMYNEAFGNAVKCFRCGRARQFLNQCKCGAP